jgi:hypothetical protein
VTRDEHIKTAEKLTKSLGRVLDSDGYEFYKAVELARLHIELARVKEFTQPAPVRLTIGFSKE